MVNTEVFLKSWDKWLLADCAFLILGFEECLIFCEINPIAVAEMGGAIGLRVNGWRPNSIGPTGFIVVGQAHSSALSWLATPLDGASNSFPFAPMTLRIMLPFFSESVRRHFSSPSSYIRNGCLAFALTVIPDFVLIANTRSAP
jgi:hypothetical protein